MKTLVSLASLAFLCSSFGATAFASGPKTYPPPYVLPSALTVGEIQNLSNWRGTFDSGSGGGSSTGQMSLETSPSISGSARMFVTTFANSGGERYWTSFGADTASVAFVYDTWLYIANSSAGIANIEMDMNQVMSNGQTVIFGFQCDGYSGTWDYTENAGTPQKYIDKWVHSWQPCNPRNWAVNTWHHVQVAYARDQYGNVTYKSVWVDGIRQVINKTVPSAFALGWGSVLLTNFQVDGLGASGTSTVYLDKLTIYRW